MPDAREEKADMRDMRKEGAGAYVRDVRLEDAAYVRDVRLEDAVHLLNIYDCARDGSLF